MILSAPKYILKTAFSISPARNSWHPCLDSGQSHHWTAILHGWKIKVSGLHLNFYKALKFLAPDKQQLAVPGGGVNRPVENNSVLDAEGWHTTSLLVLFEHWGILISFAPFENVRSTLQKPWVQTLCCNIYTVKNTWNKLLVRLDRCTSRALRFGFILW